MIPGVCISPYTWHGWLPPIPSPHAYQDLHALGIRSVRMSAEPLMESAKPSPTKDGSISFDFTLLDQWVMPAVGGNMRIYLNPGGCPPWASEGQPAYVNDGVGVWPPGAPDVPASYCGGSWWNDPKNPSAGTHYFGDPAYAAVDALMPPRPYLKNPPKRNPKYAHDLGSAITDHYQGILAQAGIENEPGGDLLQRTIADSHTMAVRRFPETYIPFAEGVDGRKLIVGCEADSADILAQFLDADEAIYRSRPSLSCCDVISIHPYGEIRNQSYSTMAAFMEVIAGRKSRRPVIIGEIGGTPEELYDFTEMVIAKYPEMAEIYYLDPAMFYGPGSNWSVTNGTPVFDPSKSVLSPIGLKFSKLFNSLS